ncbi:MAG TPA: amino acid racemase, partial [Thermomicrobiales bacterium]
RGANRLVASGVAFIAIPCNTAHAFLPQLRARVATPFLDMVAETAERVRVAHPAVCRVGILATAGTVRMGLYHAALRERGLAPLHPDARAQELVSAAIAAVKAGDTGPAIGALLVEASQALIADGAEVLLAACTELPLVLTQAMLTVPLLDPTQVLAEAAVREGRAAHLGGVSA